jgi:hypothetical protein
LNVRKLLLVTGVFLIALIQQACNFGETSHPSSTTPNSPLSQSPTNMPGNSQGTQATQAGQTSGVQLLIQGPDNQFNLVDMNGQSSPWTKFDRPLNSPVFQNYSGSRTAGRSLYGTSIGGNGHTQAYVVDMNGARPLDFIQNIGMGFALWPGNGTQAPRLAWDEQEYNQDKNTIGSKLFVSNADGSDLRTLLEDTARGRVLVAGRWSRDGQRLYYSKEPVGLGGYILFGGASNLWAVNLADGNTSQVVNEPGMACIDELSYQEDMLAHHCANPTVTIIQIASGAATTINPPVDGVEANFVGSARFSPDGQRVAFGIARGDPDHEQGWVAVSDSLSGGSHVIATAPAGEYFHVIGWMDPNTLVLQSWGVNPGVWLVKADGSGGRRLADGIYHGLFSGG